MIDSKTLIEKLKKVEQIQKDYDDIGDILKKRYNELKDYLGVEGQMYYGTIQKEAREKLAELVLEGK